MKWNNGDFVIIGNEDGEEIAISLFEKEEDGTIYTHADIPMTFDSDDPTKWTACEPNEYVDNKVLRKATWEEKEKLEEWLKKEDMVWDRVEGSLVDWPRMGDAYATIVFNDGRCWCGADEFDWCGADEFDWERKKKGLCFHSMDDARKRANEVNKAIRGK